MLGWCADFFRLGWGLLYWNTRKSWFQVRRGRAPCPCQSPSDSGRAFETQCEACTSWQRPARFRRVCPLLVETKDGLRCSANTPEVRPFWGRAFAYYSGAALAVYGVGVLAVFIFLRTVGYPVSIVHVALPPLWHRVVETRGWFFLERSKRAFIEGRTAEGILYLANSYEFDPTNYAAGLLLAKSLQVGQPAHSDRVFTQLMRDHPGKRHATAQEWLRALLARGSFEKITELARAELLADPAQAGVWLRALLFATRQTHNDGALRGLLANHVPAARIWHPLLETELLVRAGRKEEVRTAVQQPWPIDDRTRFTLFYRVSTLIGQGDTFAGLDLLEKYPGVLDAETRVTLRLEAFAAGGAKTPFRQEVDRLLAPRLTPGTLSVVKILCAQLIRYPDAETFGRLMAKVERDQMAMNTETAGVWFSLMCAAGAVGDQPRLHELTLRLKQASPTPFVALGAVEAFFRGETAERRITAFLPILPLPMEINYALLERYGQPAKRV